MSVNDALDNRIEREKKWVEKFSVACYAKEKLSHAIETIKDDSVSLEGGKNNTDIDLRKNTLAGGLAHADFNLEATMFITGGVNINRSQKLVNKVKEKIEKDIEVEKLNRDKQKIDETKQQGHL